MRIGIASAETPTWPKMDWVEQAARNLGHDVVRVKSAKDLPELLSCSDFVILGHKSLAGRYPNIIKALKNRQCPVAYWWFDLIALDVGVPLDEQVYFKQWRPTMEHCDLVLVKEQSMLDEYHDAEIDAFYFDQGCPSDIPEVNYDASREWDLMVWGQSNNHYHLRRGEVEEVVSQGFDVAWAGSVVPGTETLAHLSPFEIPETASHASCVLSCGRRNDVGGYWSDQLWMALGMGACVARRSTPNLPVDAPLLKYHTRHELCDFLRWVQKSPEESVQLGKMARQWVMENHTIEHRIEELIQLVSTAAGQGCSTSKEMVAT